jgi:hypothetical protein
VQAGILSSRRLLKVLHTTISNTTAIQRALLQEHMTAATTTASGSSAVQSLELLTSTTPKIWIVSCQCVPPLQLLLAVLLPQLSQLQSLLLLLPLP